MIKLLVVDDSAFMRMAIIKMVENQPDIKVVGEAKNGEVALQMAQQLKPDVITMDVEMPILNGVEAVERIMACAPCPIIMVSSLSTKGAAITIKSMQLGAVDFIAKSSSFIQLDIIKIEKELVQKIQSNPNYIDLIAKRSSFSLKLSFFVLAMFYSFILVIAFSKELLGVRLSEDAVETAVRAFSQTTGRFELTGATEMLVPVTTYAFPVAAVIIVVGFITTLIYVRRANGEFEDLTNAIREDVKDDL